MLEKLFFGEVTLKIDGFDTAILTERLYHTCKVISVYTKSDSIYLTTMGSYESRVRTLCKKSNCVCETLSRKGAIYTVKKYLSRYGVLLGAVIVAIAIFILSNTVMKIQINGTSDESIKENIRAVLKEDGLHAGAYIPSINLLQLSTKLFTVCDEISWASIGSSGSVVYVNVSEITKKTDSENMRIPSNIVADRDAVVTNAEVMVGKLNVLLGDAVYKGQLLVSGIIEHENGVTKYFHSHARIIGRYEENVTFEQDYIEEAMIPVETIYRKSIDFFELNLPLPGKLLNSDAKYSVRSHATPVKLLGFTLPFSVTTTEYTELHSDIKTYSTAEALKSLYTRLENYEKDILKDVEIIDKKVTEEQTDTGVSLTVKYILEGEIGNQSEIFIK